MFSLKFKTRKPYSRVPLAETTCQALCYESNDESESLDREDLKAEIEKNQAKVKHLRKVLAMKRLGSSMSRAIQGYKKISIIRDTPQGKLYKGKILNEDGLIDRMVAIKECKLDTRTDEDVFKEAIILKHLTVDNCPIGYHIIKYIGTFESQGKSHLIMEYIQFEMNLRDFIKLLLKYVNLGRMSLKHYHKMMKYLYFQLISTIRWLHRDMNCCHLDLCMENIWVIGVSLVEGEDGLFTIDPDVWIKLGGFGEAEVFKNADFQCHKETVSITDECIVSPEILQNASSYDASKVDIWSLGMIFFECMTGKPLQHNKTSQGYWVSYSVDLAKGCWTVNQESLYKYLETTDLLRCFDTHSFSLLCDLLDPDVSQRHDIEYIIKHKWLSAYYKEYKQRILKKSQYQRQSLSAQSRKMDVFPYYKHQT